MVLCVSQNRGKREAGSIQPGHKSISNIVEGWNNENSDILSVTATYPGLIPNGHPASMWNYIPDSFSTTLTILLHPLIASATTPPSSEKKMPLSTVSDSSRAQTPAFCSFFRQPRYSFSFRSSHFRALPSWTKSSSD